MRATARKRRAVGGAEPYITRRGERALGRLLPPAKLAAVKLSRAIAKADLVLHRIKHWPSVAGSSALGRQQAVNGLVDGIAQLRFVQRQLEALPDWFNKSDSPRKAR